MLAVGIILVLVGFALVVPRGGVPGSAAVRNVSLGRQRVFSTPGYTDHPSVRYRVIRIVIGLVMVVGGVVLIASSG